MWLKVNGQTEQNGSPANLVCGAVFHVFHLNQVFTQHPGDVVELGTDGLGSQKQTCERG